MLHFLISLLMLGLSIGSATIRNVAPVDLAETIKLQLSETVHESPLTTSSDSIYVDSDEENESSEPLPQEDSSVSEASPNLKKVEAYNQSSGKVIGEVAAVAVEKAKPLIACVDVPDKCYPEISPTPTPSSIPEPSPTPSPMPSPTIIPIPFPTRIPIPIPIPTIGPCPDKFDCIIPGPVIEQLESSH